MYAFCLVIVFFPLPKTNAANIIYKTPKRLTKETGHDRLRSQSEIDAAYYTTEAPTDCP